MQLNGGLQTEQARGPRFNLQSSPLTPQSTIFLLLYTSLFVFIYLPILTYPYMYVCVFVYVYISKYMRWRMWITSWVFLTMTDYICTHVHIHPALKATIRMACSISILAKDTVYWILIHRIIITSVNARKCSSPPKETVYPLAAKPCLFLTSAVSDIY